ncbi:MAG: ErpK protein [Lachnospiraceae bacterium]|nr:ErpK protein [Lachnospiraceae bacterium]
MPRTRKTISIDDKINEQKQVVSRAKAKYESALAELNDLMKKRDEIRNKQLLEAIASSDRSFEEILEFIKKSPPQE